MNLLIDTHILIWYIAGHPNLNKTMINLLEDPGNNLSISVASLWEIAIKVGKGKFDLGIEFHELEAILNQLNIQVLPILFSDLNVHLRHRSSQHPPATRQPRSSEQFQQLRKQYPRLDTMDLKIAAIVLAHDATLLTRNQRDFSQIQGLKIEDWSAPLE